MNDGQSANQTSRLDYILLVPIMALAFYVAFIPHHDYPFPVHIDEWCQMVQSNAILRTGNTIFTDPYLGQSAMTLTYHLEAGFNMFWAIFHQISGIPWIDIFRYFPGVIMMTTVLSVYTMTRRLGFGWEAALFACLIPTTVGIMGPGFLVPFATALLFIPLVIFIAFNFRSAWSYIVLFILTCAMVVIHAPTAIGAVIILVPYVLINLGKESKHSLGIILAMGIPCALPLLLIAPELLPMLKPLTPSQPLPTYVEWPQVISTYGYLPAALCAVGAFFLMLKGGRKNYGLIAGLFALFAMLIAYFRFHYGLEVMYSRGLMYLMLVMSIIAGAGLMAVRTIKLPTGVDTSPGTLWFRQNLGNILCVVLISITLAICIPARHEIPYYHMIDNYDYEAFVWIRDNVTDDYEKAILDPWKATAFTAVTEKYVYTRIHSYPKAGDDKAYNFLGSGCTDTDFLRENEISIIYTREACNNPDLLKVRENIYLLEETSVTE